MAWNVHDWLLTAIAGLSGPFVIILFPVALLRFVKSIDEKSRLDPRAWGRSADGVLIIVGICFLIQITALLTAEPESRSSAPLGANYMTLSYILASRIFFGFVKFPSFFSHFEGHDIAAVVMSLGGMALCIYAVFRGNWRMWSVVYFAAAITVASLAKPMLDLENPQ